MIKLSHVSRLYPARAESNGGVIRALDDVSLEVSPGEWLGHYEAHPFRQIHLGPT